MHSFYYSCSAIAEADDPASEVSQLGTGLDHVGPIHSGECYDAGHGSLYW